MTGGEFYEGKRPKIVSERAEILPTSALKTHYVGVFILLYTIFKKHGQNGRFTTKGES